MRSQFVNLLADTGIKKTILPLINRKDGSPKQSKIKLSDWLFVTSGEAVNNISFYTYKTDSEAVSF
jgi:uroporphyrinogen-III synthase